MATTTPNFGWQVPTSTDLVKDGAVAIETLGDAIDASLVDLKGGTTGQVLAKASNTDMDFVWSADAAGISPTIFAAKGDLLGASANDTPAVLSVGNNGETLVADSSTSTGLRWQGSTEAGKNFVINGGMDIWQRGTSFATTSGNFYTADRWACGNNANSTVTRQAASLTGFQYCLRNARNSSSTSTTNLNMVTSFETVNVIPLQGKAVTLSFYARAGANYSGASNVLNVQLEQGTGTDQNLWTGMTGSSGAIISTATLTTSWQRFTYTGTINSASTALSMNLYYAPTGTAGAADYYEVTGVQLEIGSVATTFSRAGGNIQGELAACQRYYEQTFVTAATESANKVSSYSDSNYTQGTRWKVTKRVAPSVTVYSSNGGTSNRIRQISTNVNYTPASIADIGVDGFNIFTGIAQSNMMDFHYTASAEL
jgi:hypothetical protein